METGIRVLDAMTENPIVVGPSTSLKECAKLMSKEHVGALLVKDRGKLLGIITECDIVRKLVAMDVQPSKAKATDVMTAEGLRTVSPEADIFEALTAMRDFDIRHLPVVDGGRLFGLVTMKDILKIEPDLFDLLVAKLDVREEERKPVKVGRDKEGICDICGSFSEDLSTHNGLRECPDCIGPAAEVY
jgi:CBS domain-containing protein